MKDHGARVKLRHVLCREAGDKCYIQSIWHEILTYLMPDLPRAWYPKRSIDSTKYFRKHNFYNDHVVTKITKIFYYKIWSHTVYCLNLLSVYTCMVDLY